MLHQLLPECSKLAPAQVKTLEEVMNCETRINICSKVVVADLVKYGTELGISGIQKEYGVMNDYRKM